MSDLLVGSLLVVGSFTCGCLCVMAFTLRILTRLLEAEMRRAEQYETILIEVTKKLQLTSKQVH